MDAPAPQPVLDRRFWLRHAVWPALLFGLSAVAAATTGLDESLARAWAFDPATSHFIGDGAGTWWAKDLIHGAGGRVIRILGVLVLLLWAAGFWFETLRRWRRPAGFVVLCALLGAGAVGMLKQTTNVDCPWALADFGGQQPYVRLFADRPHNLPRAQCFPGGHSSSGWLGAGCRAAGRRRFRFRPGGQRRALPLPRFMERGPGVVRVPRGLHPGIRRRRLGTAEGPGAQGLGWGA